MIVGPNGRLEFQPAELTIALDEIVEWYFDSSGHNVSCVPEHADTVRLPEGADPFASHDPGSPRQLESTGGTFENRFETAGRYVYVCIPHIDDGMHGEITVTR